MTRGLIRGLVEGDGGYTVINADKLRSALCVALRSHVFSRRGGEFATDDDDTFSIIFKHHDQFQRKSSRIFSAEHAQPIIRAVSDVLADIGIVEPFEVTDEEAVGYPNVYFRAVRARAAADVGPMHKDKWFWDLGHGSIHDGKTRVKLWIPILQDDAVSGLTIVPGSHRVNFEYNSRREDGTGKMKPVFDQRVVEQRIISAPVRVGEAIIFHDELLHGGISTDHPRISAELTILYDLDAR